QAYTQQGQAPAQQQAYAQQGQAPAQQQAYARPQAAYTGMPAMAARKPVAKWMIIAIIAAVVVLIVALSAGGAGSADGGAGGGGVGATPTGQGGGSGAGAPPTGQSGGGGGEGGGGGSGAGGGSAGQNLDAMLASGEAVQYERVACYDPEMNCEAMRSVAPAGWQAGGQVYWTMQSVSMPVTPDFFIVAPDGSARVGYVGECYYRLPDPANGLMEGQWSKQSQCPAKSYQDAQTYAQSYFQEYTGIPYTEVVDVKYLEGEALNSFGEYIALLQQEADNLLIQFAQELAASNSVLEMVWYGEAAEVVLRFEMNGVPCKAKVFAAVTYYVSTNTQELQYVGTVTTQEIVWNTPLGVCYYMAEEDVYDEYEPVANMFITNRINNEQWVGAVQRIIDELRAKHLQANYDELMAQQQQLQQYGAQAVAQSSQSYSYPSPSSGGSSGYSSSVMDGWTNVVTDQEYFTTSDGAPVLLDSGYWHTYSDGNSFVQSDSTLDLGSGWNEVSGSTMWND
ncbi:MAG: hypothetical protein FWG03_07700, partial [Clostridiales bacterium]|nr:hypothetical protein [Clostridiales bacterium]